MKERFTAAFTLLSAVAITACSDDGSNSEARSSVNAGPAGEVAEHVPPEVLAAREKVAIVERVRKRDDVDAYVDRLMEEYDTDGDGIVLSTEFPDRSPVVNGYLFMSDQPLELVVGGEGDQPAEAIRFSREDVKDVVLHFFDDADSDDDGALNTDGEAETFQQFMALQEIEMLQTHDPVK